jgi:hypothetical protein
MELIFFDKTVKVDGGIGLSVHEVPRVLGFRRYKWNCRVTKGNNPLKCGYLDVSR